MTRNLIIGGLIALIALGALPNLIENQDASEILVVQSLDGELKVFTDPGPHWQGLGKVTTYPRQKQYMFESTADRDTSIKLQFNDGGTAQLHGSVNWEMPLDTDGIIKIHKAFNSPEGIESRAVVKMLDAATYLSGPLMSSTESAGERRAELVQVINDQAMRGVYVTQVRTVSQKDPLSGQDKTTNVTEIVRNNDGTPKRQQGSVLDEFNIKLQPISIKLLDYDPIVKKQIEDRQKSTTAVQLAKAAALKAEQDAITAEKQGEANAATAKWEQEVIKAKEVTKAQQAYEVATLAAKTAEQTKREQILLGEGEAERKKLVMNADGALDKKLEAWRIVNGYYAEAIKDYQGAWVPSIVMGNSAATGTNGGQALLEMLTAKTAKDLALDMGITGAGNTKK
jgi:hypothetical protein